MHFRVAQPIRYPSDEVFTVFKDELEKVADYLPSIENIELLEQEERPNGNVRIIRRWKAKGKVPAALQSVVKPELLSWNDIATWNPEAVSCSWELESTKLKDLFDCTGNTSIVAKGDASTELVIEGDLTVYPERAVPRLMRAVAKPLAPAIEKLVVTLITSDMKNMAPSIEKYMDAKKA